MPDQWKTTLKMTPTYEELYSVSNHFGYLSSYLSSQLPPPTISNTTFHQFIPNNITSTRFSTHANTPPVFFNVNNMSLFSNIFKTTIGDFSTKNEDITNNLPEQSSNNPAGRSKLPEWKQRMIEKNEAAKKEVIDIMDDSLNSVMAKIEKKPENQQEQAVKS